jgi:hypothetical protein
MAKKRHRVGKGARVEVSTSEYESTHGHKPRGVGTWGFEIGRPMWNAEAGRRDVVRPTWIPGDKSYSEARRAAERIARERDVDFVNVCP